jgi:hypothetical protein
VDVLQLNGSRDVAPLANFSAAGKDFAKVIVEHMAFRFMHKQPTKSAYLIAATMMDPLAAKFMKFICGTSPLQHYRQEDLQRTIADMLARNIHDDTEPAASAAAAAAGSASTTMDATTYWDEPVHVPMTFSDRILQELVVIEKEPVSVDKFAPTWRGLRDALREGYDPSAFWRQHHGRYPNLAKAARRILPIPVSSARTEGVHAVANQTLPNERNRLLENPADVEALVMLRVARQNRVALKSAIGFAGDDDAK